MKNESTLRIGVLGGTFNPIHIGHLILAQNAIDMYELSKIIFMPCSSPPHKEAMGLISAEHRMEMVSAAISDNFSFELSDIEIERGGRSYSIDTMRQVRELYPTADHFFIVGSDTLPELHLWKDIRDLLELCEFVTFCRPGFNDTESISAEVLALEAPWPERLFSNLRVARLIEVSSSDIRYRIAEGLSIQYLVTQDVEMYIAEHGLYVT